MCVTECISVSVEYVFVSVIMSASLWRDHVSLSVCFCMYEYVCE